jgi:NAD(P)H-hydrate repair Nnr-like enzyme with NAD(P)H-hydrate epimerase domain
MHHLLAQSLSRLGVWEEAVEAHQASIRARCDRGSRIWLLLAGDQLNLGDTLVAAATLDSADVRARTDAGRTATHEMRAALASDPNRNEPQ